MVPPTFLWTLISLKSTLVDPELAIIFKTESTAIGDNSLALLEITFEDKEVFTHSINYYLLSKSTYSDISSKIF